MSLPYHNLGEAQRRLVNGLSDNTLYLKTIRTSMWDALQRIWGEASTYTYRRQADAANPDTTFEDAVRRQRNA